VDLLGCSTTGLVAKYELGHISATDKGASADKNRTGKEGHEEGMKGSPGAPREKCEEGSDPAACKGGKGRGAGPIDICYSSDEDNDSDEDVTQKGGKGNEKGSDAVLGEDSDPAAEQREQFPKIYYATRTHSQIAQVHHGSCKECPGFLRQSFLYMQPFNCFSSGT
jgi:hypothetical protein